MKILVTSCWLLVVSFVELLVRRHVLLVFICAVVLSACGKSLELPPLLKGVQNMTGTLLPTELSLLRRGTHVIRIDGQDAYFVESSSVNLRRYDGKEVFLEGTLEYNDDPEYLPVLVVSQVLDVLEEQTKEWSFWSLDLRLHAPEAWQASVRDDDVTFSVPAATGAILRIYQEETAEYTGGTTIVVGAKRGVRMLDEQSGTQTVVVEIDEDVSTVFSFTPNNHPKSHVLREEFVAMLHTVEWLSDDPLDDPETPFAGSGAAIGSPCGGPAGILCPAGLYCNVTNLEENIGVCETL